MKKSHFVILVIIACAGLFVGGMFTGKAVFRPNVIKEVTTVQYRPGQVIRDTIRVPEIRWEKQDTAFIAKWDTIKADTTALFAVWTDWNAQRGYHFDFSTDTTGTFMFDVLLMHNKIQEFRTEIQPLIRNETMVRTVEHKRRVQPWAMVGSSVNLNSIKASAGVDFNQKWVFGVSAMKVQDQSGFTINFGIKF